VSEAETPVFIRSRVPESVRARFKAACALQSRDMSEVLEELIMQWLKENEPILPPTTTNKRRKTSTEEALFRASRFVDEPDRDNLIPSEDLPTETKKPASAKAKQGKGSAKSS